MRVLDPGGQPVFKRALKGTEKLRHGYVCQEHLLLGLLAEEECFSVYVLKAFGLGVEVARRLATDLAIQGEW